MHGLERRQPQKDKEKKACKVGLVINPLETTTNNIGTIAMVQSTGANNIGRD